MVRIALDRLRKSFPLRMAVPARLERATYGLPGACSIQLSYGTPSLTPGDATSRRQTYFTTFSLGPGIESGEAIRYLLPAISSTCSRFRRLSSEETEARSNDRP